MLDKILKKAYSSSITKLTSTHITSEGINKLGHGEGTPSWLFYLALLSFAKPRYSQQGLGLD